MEEKPKRFRLNKLTLLILVVLVAAGAGAAYFYKNQDKNSSASLPAGWSEYKNEEHGFKFNYRKDWGKPEIFVNELQKGKRYSIRFIELGNSSKQISFYVLMDTNDAEIKTCVSQDECSTIQALTSQKIEENLGKDTENFVIYDNDSYATIKSDLSQKIATSLTINSKVSIPKLNITAAQIVYLLYGLEDVCSENKFSEVSKTNCITKDIYNELSTFIKTIRPI